jgi:hypothetical protein
MDRLQAVHQVCAADTVVVTLREYARLPRLARTPTTFRGLDQIRSWQGQGLMGVVIRS